jgi:hypothetical protein
MLPSRSQVFKLEDLIDDRLYTMLCDDFVKSCRHVARSNFVSMELNNEQRYGLVAVESDEDITHTWT